MPDFKLFDPGADEPREARPSTLQDRLIDAHGRELNRQGLTAETYGFNQFIEDALKRLDAEAPQAAREIRDWREQRRIKGRGGDIHSTIQAEEERRIHPVQAGAETALLGVSRFADVATLGGSRVLGAAAFEGAKALGAVPEKVSRMSGTELLDKGQQSMREESVEGGVPDWVVGGVESAGQIAGFLTAAGYVTRFGDVLKVAPGALQGLNVVGRALQNPVINFAATEALLTEGEIQAGNILGEDTSAMRDAQGARVANSAVLGALMPGAQWLGRFVERGLLKAMVGAPTRAAQTSRAIQALPSVWLKARAAGAHVGGKVAEFQVFGILPAVYRPDQGGKMELTPWVKKILNPKVIADQLSGKSNEWVGGVKEILRDFVEHFESGHWKQEGLAGGIIGGMGAARAAMGGPAKIQAPWTVGPRGLMDPAKQAEAEQKFRGRVDTAGRKALTDKQIKAMEEAIEKGLQQSANPEEAVQAIVDYVVAAGEMQTRLLRQQGIIPRDAPTLATNLRRTIEREWGPELFTGKAKDDATPDLGIPVEIIKDPAKPGQPGRRGQVLERFKATPGIGQEAVDVSARGQQVELARVRFDDGSIGIVPVGRLKFAEAGKGERALMPDGQEVDVVRRGVHYPQEVDAQNQPTPNDVAQRISTEGAVVRLKDGSELIVSVDMLRPVPKPESPPAGPAAETPAQATPPPAAPTAPPGAPTGPAGPPTPAPPPSAPPAAPTSKPTETPEQRRQRRARAARRGRKTQVEVAKEGERRANEKAYTDDMTGLPNQRARQAAQARIDADPGLVWVMGDLRGFKALNDALNQTEGDAAIRKSADAWRKAAEEAGVSTRMVFRAGEPPEAGVFRAGGDEFAAAMTPAQAKAFRAAVDRLKIEQGGQTVTFRTSEGATWGKAAEGMVGAKKGEKAPEKAQGPLTEAQERELDTASQGVGLGTGRRFSARLFRGTGATREEVYGEENIKAGRGNPILGPGTYYAYDPRDAKTYAGKAGKVERQRVTLENPLVIKTNQEWSQLLEDAGSLILHSVYYPGKGEPMPTEAQRVAASVRLQEYVRSRGHDGMIVAFDPGMEKRLRESFGHWTAVVFGQPAAAPPAPRRVVGKKTKAAKEPTKEPTAEPASLTKAMKEFIDLDAKHTGVPMPDVDALTKKMTKAQLVEAAKGAGLTVTGTRPQMVKQIKDFLDRLSVSHQQVDWDAKRTPLSPVSDRNERAAITGYVRELYEGRRKREDIEKEIEGLPNKDAVSKAFTEEVARVKAAADKAGISEKEAQELWLYATTSGVSERADRSPDAKAKVDRVNDILGRMPAAGQQTTIRTEAGNLVDRYPEGREFTVDNLFATSAGGEASARTLKNQDTYLEVRGTSGRDISELAPSTSTTFERAENEVLYGRGTKFKVVGHEKDADGKTKIVLEEATTAGGGDAPPSSVPPGLRQQPIDRAAAEGGLLSDSILAEIGGDPASTLSEAIKGPKGDAFRKELSHRLGQAGSDLFRPDRKLTAAGEEFVENMLLLKGGLPKDLVQSLSPQLRRTMSNTAVQLAKLKSRPETEEISNRIGNALDWVNRHLEGGRIPVATYLAEDPHSPSILDVKTRLPADLVDRALIEILQRNHNAPRRLREGLARLVKEEDPKQGRLLPEEPDRPLLERVAEAFDLQVSRDQIALEKLSESSKDSEMPAPGESINLDALTHTEREASGRPADPVTYNQEAPIGGLRMPLSLEQRDSWGGERTSQTAIVDRMKEVFEVPIEIGRYRRFLTGDAIGVYKGGPHVVRIKTAGDFVVAAHEVGHSIQTAVLPAMAKDKRWVPMQGELVAIAKTIYPKEPANGWLAEGWAESMRLYIIHPELLAKHAPKTMEWIKDSLMPGDKKFAAGVEEIRQMVRDYGDQGWYERLLAPVKKGPQGLTRFEQNLRSISRENWIEELAPLERLVKAAQERGADFDSEANPYEMASFWRNTPSARVEYMAERGMIDAAGRKTGVAPLADAFHIVRGLAKQAGLKVDAMEERFTAWLVAKRTVELYERGIVMPKFDIKDARRAVEVLEAEFPRFLDAGKIVWDWNRGILTYMRQLGAVSEADYTRVMQRSNFYIPFSVALERVSAGPLRSALERSPLRRIEGSGRDIRDPFPQMVAQAAQMIRFAHRRAITRAMTDLHKIPNMGEFVEKVDADVLKKTKPLEAFKKQLEEAGVDLTDVDLSQLITWYEPKRLPDSKDPILPVLNDKGKIEWFQVKEDLYKSMAGMDPYRLPGMLDTFLGVPARMKRLGTTGLRASFSLVTNPIRDYFTMLLQSREKNPLKVTAAWARGQMESLGRLFGKESEYGELWRSTGGEMTQPLGQDLARTFRLGENVGRRWYSRVARDIKRGRIFQAVGDIADVARDVLQIPEAGPRIAEMRIRAKQLGIDPKMIQSMDFKDALRSMIKLKKAGAEVTVDFAAAGRYARMINAAIPFFNVAIQGPRAFGRAWKRNPVATSLIGIGLAHATLALWGANRDEQWYKDLPWTEKFGYWHIRSGKDRIRIPRPFEIGLLFATIPEAIADAEHRGDREQYLRVMEYAKDVLIPDLLPVIPQEALEQARNKDSFRNAPIVPMGETRLPPGEQYGSSTSVAATKLGKLMGWSPRRIDHAVQAVFGGLGRDVAELGGVVKPSGYAWQPSDIPVLGRLFAIDGVDGYSSQAVQDLFDMRSRLQTRSASKDDPASPQEKAALRILEKASKRLKDHRKKRQDAGERDDRTAELQAMRDISTQALERAREILRGASSSSRPAEGARPEGRSIFGPRILPGAR